MKTTHSFRWKRNTFENALQSGKIFKRNASVFMWTSRIYWKLFSKRFRLHLKIQGGYRPRTCCCFYRYIAPVIVLIVNPQLNVILVYTFSNNAFYIYAVESCKSLLAFCVDGLIWKRSCGTQNTFIPFSMKWKRRKRLKTYFCERSLKLYISCTFPSTFSRKIGQIK